MTLNTSRADTAAELIARSNRLGADPRNTNYAGGNTSAKGTETDPVTGEDVELLWVKGSGGDLGTLTESGLAVLRLDRMRALVDVYPGLDREDEMVAAFDYCLHGKGGAAPSIDTAMHGLVDAAHVDHLHPDSGIAIATSADGEGADRDGLRRQGRVGAVAPPRLPARPRHRRDQGQAPRGDRLHPRWSRHHRMGRHQRRRPSRTRCGSSRPQRRTSRSTHGPSRSARRSRATAHCRRPSAAHEGRRPRADDPLDRVCRSADGRPLHRQRRRAGLPRVERAPAPRRARHQLPRPLPAYEGQAARARPARLRDGRGVDRATA